MPRNVGTAGATGNPSIFAFSTSLRQLTNRKLLRDDLSGMTILKILFVEIVPAFFGQ
jgi:hypothetical protein